MKRFGAVAKVRPDRLDEYVKLHAAVWPGVLSMIEECQIQNYSIYLKQLPDGQRVPGQRGLRPTAGMVHRACELPMAPAPELIHVHFLRRLRGL